MGFVLKLVIGKINWTALKDILTDKFNFEGNIIAGHYVGIV